MTMEPILEIFFKQVIRALMVLVIMEGQLMFLVMANVEHQVEVELELLEVIALVMLMELQVV